MGGAGRSPIRWHPVPQPGHQPGPGRFRAPRSSPRRRVPRKRPGVRNEVRDLLGQERVAPGRHEPRPADTSSPAANHLGEVSVGEASHIPGVGQVPGPIILQEGRIRPVSLASRAAADRTVLPIQGLTPRRVARR